MKYLIFALFLFITNSNAASMNMVGEKGDPNKIDRVIEIEMYDNYYYPTQVDVKKGETIKFVVKNLGKLVHEYNIGTKEMHIKHQPEMVKLVENEILLADKIDHKKMKEMAKKDHSLGHSHANSVLLEPMKTGEIIWKFTKDISLEMACNMPGHYEAGMVGKIIIE
jgi:uncharacterized cupredoxin-like copper-binding protein|tara:strand:- start:1063 stop:1560 length:498 start_codon:yes stop_codon:yes gene_type:complete